MHVQAEYCCMQAVANRDQMASQGLQMRAMHLRYFDSHFYL